jgi:chromosome segregation ATPase
MPDFQYDPTSPLLDNSPGAIREQIDHLLGELGKSYARQIARPSVPEAKIQQLVEQRAKVRAAQLIEERIRPQRERAEKAEAELRKLQDGDPIGNLTREVLELNQQLEDRDARIEQIKTRSREAEAKLRDASREQVRELKSLLAKRDKRVAELEKQLGDREPAEAA